MTMTNDSTWLLSSVSVKYWKELNPVLKHCEPKQIIKTKITSLSFKITVQLLEHPLEQTQKVFAHK